MMKINRTAAESIGRALPAAGIAADADAISEDTLFAITNRVLLESDKPSAYFRALREDDQLSDLYPELNDMIGVPQEPRFHPEGDVFEHTMLVIDRASELRCRAAFPLEFMYAALLHDAGKCEATVIREDGRIIAYRHELMGDARISALLDRLTDDRTLAEHVRNHTYLHMRPNMLYGAKSRKKKTRQLFDLSVCPEDLILLSRADASGKTDAPYDENAETWLNERLADYRARASAFSITESDLAALGITDRGDLEARMNRARQLHFAGLNKLRVLKQIMQENLQDDITD